MPKRKVTTCDLCGSDDMGDYICENCQKKIKEAAEYSRKEDETNAARN